MRILQDGQYKLKLLAHDEMLTSCNTGDYVLFKDGGYLLVYLGEHEAIPITDDHLENVADAVRASKKFFLLPIASNSCQIVLYRTLLAISA